MTGTGALRSLDRRLLPPLARALRRLGRGAARMRTLPVLALVSVAAVLLSAVWMTGRRPVGDPTVGDVVRVGVAQGQSIPAYLQASRAELAALAVSPPAGRAEVYALVTLRAYLAPDRLAAVLAGVSASHVYARVPLPRTQTQIVQIAAYRLPGDVRAGMTALADRKDAEAAEYRRLAATVTGTSQDEHELRARYATGADVAAAEAIAYQEQCSCVYAAVVRAAPAALGGLGSRPEVRAVDPAPEVRRVDRAVFLPPLPEQTDTARPPEDGPLAGTPPARPNPSPSVVRK